MRRSTMAALLLTACGGGRADDDTTAADGTGTMSGTLSASGTASATSTGGGTADEGGSTSGATDPYKFDVGDSAGTGNDTAPPPPTCKVVDDMDAVGECGDEALPDSFEPDVQWSFPGEGAHGQSIVIPLVANLTDDNSDGEIDLCDVPDVVVTAFSGYGQWDGYIWVLDGETGTVHWQSPVMVDATVTPALGDIDGDLLPEIVAVTHGSKNMVAFEHDGTMKWQGQPWNDYGFGAIALGDLDNDGAVEIVAGNLVFDATGLQQLALPDSAGAGGFGNATAAADLDDDGDLEIVLGRSAYHHDGAQLYMQAGIQPSYPQIADLDDDPQPEVLLENQNGISILEHDGTIKFQDLRPTGDAASLNSWMRPSTVHDFDGDDVSEFAVSSSSNYAVYERDATIVWTAAVVDTTGIAAGTAFDFLGDGIAEAMYADENQFFIYDGTGTPLLTVPRSSGTLIEYPVVADIDNDGSAEILVVSNEGWMGNQTAPLVQAIRDVDDRWIQARRIWNQHTYHVTNVREDGTIPQVEPHSWELLNTYRTNAQIENGGVCKPPPEG